MDQSQPGKFKTWLDRFLMLNLLLIFFGFLFFCIGAAFSSLGNNTPYEIFQRLWFPLFIPALSTFFTAVLVEFLWNRLS